MTKTFTVAAAVLTLAGVLAGLTATGGSVDPVLTWSLAVALAGFVLATRRWPLTALILMLLTVAGWRTAHLIEAGWVWPSTAAFAALVLAGRLRAAVVTGVVALGHAAAWEWSTELPTADQLFLRIGGEALWLGAVLAAASAYLSGQRWRTEMARRLAEDESRRAIDARRRRAEERVEIARDLHDVVSHTLAVVGVHLNVAMDAFDAEPEEARASLKLAQDVRSKAMVDLKALVGVLREGEVPELESLQGLIQQVREAGLQVSLNEFGDPVEVPSPVSTAVFRVVQEALTNTVRHAGASRAIVTLRYNRDSVLVDVQDDGHGSDMISDGHGIAGMRERVAALGGVLTAGPGKDGFHIRAGIPLASA